MPAALSSQFLSQDPEFSLTFGICDLRIEQFRNYSLKKLSLPSLQSVVLTGPNGSGKTNILESISWFSPGRGLRKATLSEALHIEGSSQALGWGIALQLKNDAIITSMGTGVIKDAISGDLRRVIHVDHKPLKTISSLNQYLTIQWVTPEMDRILSGPSSDRRQFLDRIVYAFDNTHAHRVTQYEVALRERLRLLKSKSYDANWIGSLERKLSELSVAITASRLHFIEEINKNKYWTLSAFPQCTLKLDDATSNALLAGNPAAFVEEFLCNRFFTNRSIDARVGMTHEGAHRADLQVTFNLKNMPASLCSTGEQKACLLSIICATCSLLTAQEKPNPILLLDEVIAHLDTQRRKELFIALRDLNIQAWMTGTDRAMFEQAHCEAHYETLGQ